MRSSEYFRAQARLYRDIAQMISDRQASERAMTFAAEYLERPGGIGTAGTGRVRA
jgi:hypothetical protein